MDRDLAAETTIDASTTAGRSDDVLDTAVAGGMVVRGGVLRFASYVAAVALSVISAALLTRDLGANRFGLYTTVLSLVGIVTLVTDAGMSTLGVQEYAVRRGADRDKFMRSLLGLRIALTLLGVLATVLFALLAGYGGALIAGAALASLSTIALVLQHTYTIPISTELRIGVLSALELARQILSVAAIVILLVAGAGLFGLLAVNLLVYALLLPVTGRASRGQISLRMDLHPQRWLALLRLTMSFSVASAVGTVYVYTAQILTSLVSSQHQSGLFATSFRIFIVLVTVPGLLVSGALPLLARAERDDRHRLAYALQRIFEVSLAVGVAVSLGLLAGAHFIIATITGPKFPEYAGAVPVLQIQGLALVASFLVSGWGYALLSLKRYGRLLTVNAIALIVSATLTISLAASAGAKGASIATVCGEATLAVGYLIFLMRDRPDLRPKWRCMPRIVIATVPAATLAFSLGLPSLPLTVLTLCVYAALIVATKALPPEVFELIPLKYRVGRR